MLNDSLWVVVAPYTGTSTPYTYQLINQTEAVLVPVNDSAFMFLTTSTLEVVSVTPTLGITQQSIPLGLTYSDGLFPGDVSFIPS